MKGKKTEVQQDANPIDTIKAIIHQNGFKISSMKRGFYKKQLAPAGFTRLIVRIKGGKNNMLYEGADFIKVSDDAAQNQETENMIINRLFNKFINK